MPDKKGYPADFIQRVKKAYPESSDLHEALDEGRELVGRFLDDGSQGEIDPKTVTEMISKGQIHKLREEAEELLARQDLYREWLELYPAMLG